MTRILDNVSFTHVLTIFAGQIKNLFKMDASRKGILHRPYTLRLFMCHVKLDNETFNNLYFRLKNWFKVYAMGKCILINHRAR